MKKFFKQLVLTSSIFFESMSQSGNNTSSSTGTVSATQVLSLPIGQNLANPLTRTLAPSVGSIAFDSGLQKLYIGTTTGWVLVTSA